MQNVNAIIPKITLYQLKEFSKVQENGLSEKRPSRSSQRRPSQTVLKIYCFEYFPKFPREATVVDSFN